MLYEKRLLPGFCYSAKALSKPTGFVIHFVSAIYAKPDAWQDTTTIIEMLKELNRPQNQRGLILKKVTTGENATKRDYASYHVLIARDGQASHLTPWDKQAYHAGASAWKGVKHCNGFMYGLSCIATGKTGFTDGQYDTLVKVMEERRKATGLALAEVAGHDEVSPGRKFDPGKFFDWSKVRR